MFAGIVLIPPYDQCAYRTVKIEHFGEGKVLDRCIRYYVAGFPDWHEAIRIMQQQNGAERTQINSSCFRAALKTNKAFAPTHTHTQLLFPTFTITYPPPPPPPPLVCDHPGTARPLLNLNLFQLPFLPSSKCLITFPSTCTKIDNPRRDLIYCCFIVLHDLTISYLTSLSLLCTLYPAWAQRLFPFHKRACKEFQPQPPAIRLLLRDADATPTSHELTLVL